MKMKKIVSIVAAAALLVSMAAATAFAVGSVPSKTGEDADAGKTDVSISGTGDLDGLYVDVEATESSAEQEAALKQQGVLGYLGGSSANSAASLLGTAKENLTISEIKQLLISGYSEEMEDLTLKVPFAALPKAGTRVAVLLRLDPKDPTKDRVLDGIVVEEIATVNGVSKKVRKVMFTLDKDAAVKVQAGEAFLAIVTVK